MAEGGLPSTSTDVEPFPVKKPSFENFAKTCEEVIPLKGPTIKDSCVFMSNHLKLNFGEVSPFKLSI